MRILNVVQFYYPFQEKGGPVVKIRALAQSLAKRGHQITVLTADWGLRSRNGGRNLNLERCRWGWRAREGSVETVYLPSWASYRALSLNPRVIGFCRNSLESFDLVHFFGIYDVLGPAVGFFCRRASLPYILEPMGMYRPMDRGLIRKSLWHQSFGKAFCSGAAQFIATAEIERQTLIEQGIPPAKIAVRFNGVDSDLAGDAGAVRGQFRQKWSIPSDEPVILFLSRLIPRKGADILIRAFSEACPKSARLVIAGPEGEPGYRADLETQARDCGVGSRIIFTGPLYDDDKIAAFADADLFVLPSRYENFGNVVAEAIACGVPAIVSDACGIAPLIEDQAGLVISPRSDVLAAALRSTFEDGNLLAGLKHGCREVAERLNWEHLAAQMENHYIRVLAG